MQNCTYYSALQAPPLFSQVFTITEASDTHAHARCLNQKEAAWPKASPVNGFETVAGL